MDPTFMPLITLDLTFSDGYNIGRLISHIRAQNIVGVSWRAITANKFEIFAQVNVPGVDIMAEMRADFIVKAFTEIAKWAIREYPRVYAELSADAHFIFWSCVQLKM